MNTLTKIVVLIVFFFATSASCVDICIDDCVQGMFKICLLFYLFSNLKTNNLNLKKICFKLFLLRPINLFK